MTSTDNHLYEKSLLQLLQELGYHYLTSAEAIQMRGANQAQVLLEPVLREQIERINGNVVSGEAIEEAVRALYNPPLEKGYLSANQHIYNLIRQGKLVENYLIHYIDWEYPANNRFHVTDNYFVKGKGQIIPDIVLFINGIPVSVIEIKMYHNRVNRHGAIEQHLRNQLPDGIRELYMFSHLLFSLTNKDARYGTNASPEQYWYTWKEVCPEEPHEVLYKLFGRQPLQQEEFIYNMARPERLLDLLQRFVIFEKGVKRVARWYQYFVVQEAMNRIREKKDNTRRGGIICHTTGSGKSLTMVMLAQAILLDKTIENPRIILVTDRLLTDRQLTVTFLNCGIYVETATTGKHLVELLESKTNSVISTVVQKFEPAMKQIKNVQDSSNIFVLVDEAHRTQNMLWNSRIQDILSNACFIGFTGLPFTEKYKLFDKVIPPVYSFTEAIQDNVVTPFRVETRVLKKSNSLFPDILLGSKERIQAVAKNISEDFHIKSKDKKGSFKGMLSCSDISTAIRYKKYFDETGTLSTEVLIAIQAEEAEEIKEFRHQIINTYGSVGKYHENILYRFKNSSSPELLIGVNMLFEGIDEPKNTVLYIDRLLESNALLQAIGRVNRIYPGKKFGYIVDYRGGVSDALQEASLLTETVNGEYSEKASTIVSDNVLPFRSEVKNYPATTFPVALADNPYASACYRVVWEGLKKYNPLIGNPEQTGVAISLEADRIVCNCIHEEGMMIVDWPWKINIRKTIALHLEDYLADQVKKEFNLTLSWETIDKLRESLLTLSIRIYGEHKDNPEAENQK